MCEISMMSTLVALIQAFLTKTNQHQKEVRNDDHLKSDLITFSSCSIGWMINNLRRESIFWDTCLLFWYINPLPALFKYNKYYLALIGFLNELSSWIYQDEFLRETGSLINSPFKASLHGGGGPQVGKVARLGEVTRLTIKFLILFWSRLHDRWGDPPGWVARSAR